MDIPGRGIVNLTQKYNNRTGSTRLTISTSCILVIDSKSEILSYCVWLYYTFPLSYWDIEKMMLYRGIEVTYESIREWCQKFGQQYANQLRRQRP